MEDNFVQEGEERLHGREDNEEEFSTWMTVGAGGGRGAREETSRKRSICKSKSPRWVSTL